MPKLRLYNHKKRINSTLRPSGDGNLYEFVYKPPLNDSVLGSDNDMHNPVVIIEHQSYVAQGLDYAIIEGQNGERDMFCYVVRKLYHSQSIVEYHLKCDVLATYKEHILETEAFILYSSTINSILISDTRNTVTNNVSYDVNIAYIDRLLETSGCYILTVTNIDKINSVYIIAGYMLGSLTDFLIEQNINDDFEKMFGNTLGAVISLQSCPFNIEKFSTLSQVNIKIANLDSGIRGYILPDIATIIKEENIIIDIPFFSEIRQHYVNYPPYSTHSVYLPGCGYNEFSTAVYGTRMYITLNYAPATGETVYTIYNEYSSPRYVIDRFVCNLNTPLSLTSSTIPAANAITSMAVGALTVVGGLAAASYGAGVPVVAGTLAGGISTMTSGIITANTESYRTFGANGPGSADIHVDPTIKVKCVFRNPSIPIQTGIPEMNKVAGTPLFRVDTLNNHIGGYVQCSHASVNTTAYYDEYKQINEYLNSGIYIE